MDDDKPITAKVTDAVVKAADSIKKAFEEFPAPTAKVTPVVFPSNDGFISDGLSLPLGITATQIKRTTPKAAKNPVKKANKYAATKLRKPVKKPTKTSAKKTAIRKSKKNRL